MGDHGRDVGGLLYHPMDPVGSRPLCARSGRAGRSGQSPLLHVRHRDLAARILLCRGPSGHGGHRPVSRHLRGRTGLVRLCLPADGLDRCVPARRPVRRWRPQRAHASRQGAMDGAKNGPAAVQVEHLSVHRLLDRRCLDHVFCRCAYPGGRLLDRPGRLRCLCLGRDPDRNNLRLRRVHARAGMHLHVPLAAHPDRDDGRKFTDRDLQGLARRTAWEPEKGRSPSRQLWRLRRLQSMRRGLPDRDRYSRGAADRLHYLCLVYRCM